MIRNFVLPLAVLISLPSPAADASGSGGGPANPILFVTQFPIAADFATIGSTFAKRFWLKRSSFSLVTRREGWPSLPTATSAA